LLPYGGGERVCLGKALAELEIRLLAVGLLQQLTLTLEADQDLTLKIIPSPSPADGLLVRAYSRASQATNRTSTRASDGNPAAFQVKNGRWAAWARETVAND
jgi:hypothetical protein